MHLAVYAATGAHAIVHTHSLFATSVGTVCDELPALHYTINALGGPVRVAPYSTFGSDELAAGVAAALHGRAGALMRNHGAITVGPTLAAAYDRAVKLEWLSELYWRATLLGAPSVLSTGDLAAAREQARGKAYRP
jgi:L-fuculose-phosphate aldolase